MGNLNSTITITGAEYRPCYVDGEKALFHRWTDKEKIIIKTTVHLPAETIADMVKIYDEYGILMSGLDCEKQQATLAIVEYEDGTISEVAPSSIKFADDKIKEYAFNSTGAEISHGKNISQQHPVDEFICSECGLIMRELTQVKIDEDDGDETFYEFEFKYCPKCGIKIESE